MGDIIKRALRVKFDRRLRLEFHGAKVTSDAGLLLYREFDDVFGLTTMAEELLVDGRRGKNAQHTLTSLLRQSVNGRMAGYEDTNDADRLRVDSAMRRVVGGRALERLAASTSQMNRFETGMLTSDENLGALADLCGSWVDRVNARTGVKEIILDLDSSDSPTHGEQEGSAFNGHFGCTCHHPLFCFNQYGDVERVMLREGNVHSADNWRAVLEPVVDRYRGLDIQRFYRGDAAFANPGVYEFLEAESYFYAIRLPANDVLYEKIEHLLTRPVDRPSSKPKILQHSFMYQAESWDRPRRVVAKVEWHAEELFPRVGFIVTSLKWRSKRVVKFYNKRGTAEQWIKEGKHAIRWTRLSCHDFRDNEVRLQLFVLAYNLANFLRQLALPRKIERWSLTTLREKLIKIGAKVVQHGRYIIFQLAEVAVPRKLFAQILERIYRLRYALDSG